MAVTAKPQRDQSFTEEFIASPVICHRILQTVYAGGYASIPFRRGGVGNGCRRSVRVIGFLMDFFVKFRKKY